MPPIARVRSLTSIGTSTAFGISTWPYWLSGSSSIREGSYQPDTPITVPSGGSNVFSWRAYDTSR